MKYRCKVELAAAVLFAALIPHKKTHIMNNCNLNSKQLNTYLNMMLSSSLLSFNPVDEAYSITKEGRKFLRIYKVFRQYSFEANKKLRIAKEKQVQLESMCSGSVVEELPVVREVQITRSKITHS